MSYLYRQSFENAKLTGEIEAYRESRTENIRCKKAIESAISDSFDGFTLNKNGAKKVIADFGYDRTMWVLAASILNKKDDGRFSRENKEWARSVIPSYLPQKEMREYCVDSHPAVLNGFIDQVKKRYDRLGLVGEKQCVQSDKPQDYERKLLILKPEILNEQFKDPINQYFYAAGGFGCDPEKSGRKVFGQFLADDEKAQFYREDFFGVADYEQLPKWAVERLEQIEAPQMKIRIFQIDHEKDRNKLAFMNYDYTQSHGGIKAENYRQIYGGTVTCDSLESVFALCNSDKTPPGYLGESMSVSNVIEICDGKDKGFYFCDSVGFKPIDFDIDKTNHSDIMKILIVENGKAPYEAEIRNDIHAMQEVVGGSIEPIYFEPQNNALCWCDDEFLLNGSAPNRIVGETLVHGTFYISGNYRNEYGEWDSCSLTDEQIEKYKEQFNHVVVNLPGIGLIAVRETKPEIIEPDEEFEEEHEIEQTM